VLRAAGPWGDKSVIEWPEYHAPEWLDSIADEGRIEWIEIRCRRLVARVQVCLYATPDPPSADAPLLVVHDGPEYAQYSRLRRFLDAMSWEERIPPLRAALIQPVDRDETYSASAQYGAALVRELLPELDRHCPHGVRIGMGASLGALALLHAHMRHPRAFDGLFLQSGSFFRQRSDGHESGFPRYRRITRFVGTVLRGSDGARPIPVALTCGTAEENLANNRAVAEALERQGHTAWLAEVRDAHNWAGGHVRPAPAGVDRGVRCSPREIDRRRRRARAFRPLRTAGRRVPVRRRVQRLGGSRDGRAVGDLLDGGS
jgi:enterochelin esterase family protein